MNAPVIYTVGHSTHAAEKLLDLLTLHGVTAVADVRSSPFSRMNPHFNQDPLRALLKRHGISYVFLGKELGARSDDPTCYEGGKVIYERLARSPLFEEGVTRLRKGLATRQIALLCAEKEPLSCHRTILVSRRLYEEGIAVSHIHEDGRLEPHAEAMRRLLKLLGLPEADLFRSSEQMLAEAYLRQEHKIAYVDPERAEGEER